MEPEEETAKVMFVSLVVAKVCESDERPFMEVMPVSVKERQLPPIAKQPSERLMPFANVEVPPETVRLLVMLKSVDVARVKSALVPVMIAAKRLVLVAFVEVLFVEERDCSVDDAREMSPPQKEETPEVAVIVSVVIPPNTSRREAEVVPARPIKTWFEVVEVRIPELLKNVQLISDVPPEPASAPQVTMPFASVYSLPQEVKAEVVRRFVMVRLVAVAFPRMPFPFVNVPGT